MLTFVGYGVNILIVLAREHQKNIEEAHKISQQKKLKKLLTNIKKDVILNKASGKQQNIRTQTTEDMKVH